MMKLFHSTIIGAILTIVFASAVLAIPGPNTWSSIAPNSLVDTNTNANMVAAGNNKLSGVIDHTAGVDSGFEILFATSLATTPTGGFYHELAWTGNGSKYSSLTSTAFQPSMHPYIVRLSNTGSGTRLYVFYSDPSSINTLSVDSSNAAAAPTNFISLNQFPSANTVKVYSGTGTILSVSATVCNDMIYIAIQWTSQTITIVGTVDMVSFVDYGQAIIDSPSGNVIVYGDFSLICAAGPNPASETLWLHHISSSSSASNLFPIVGTISSPPTFSPSSGYIINDVNLTGMTGVTATVSRDGRQALLVRSGKNSTLLGNVIYWSTIFTSTGIRSSELPLIDSSLGAGSGLASSSGSITPALLFDRVAGNATSVGPVSIVWAGSSNSALNSLTGDPFY